MFFVPTLRNSGDLEHFGERRYVFPRFFVPTLQYSGDLEQFGERRYGCDGVFVPTQVPVSILWGVLRFGVVWGDAVRWDAVLWYVQGMKVASVCSVVETSRKKHLAGKRRCNFPMFFVPTLQYSSYLECFGERWYVFPRFFVPTLRYSGDFECCGERRYECDGVFVPTQVSVPIPWGVLRFGVVWGDAVQWDAMPYDGMRC